VTLLFSSSQIVLSQSDCDGTVTVNLSALNAPSNLWRIEDVLNITITNNAQEDLDIFLFSTVTDTEYGLLFELESSSFLLSAGYNGSINPADIGSVDVKNYNSKRADFIQDVLINTGTLPAGDYEICVEVLDHLTQYCYGRACINQIIAHPSPPELIFPSDESTLLDELPIFTWMPPMPTNSNVDYTIEIVEILDSQNPIEAMEVNFRWFETSGIGQTSFQYPISNREFIYGSRYAWRVGAVIYPEFSRTQLALVLSPVWSFTFLGSQGYAFNQPYTINPTSPANNEIVGDVSFFSWDLVDPSAQTAENRVFDEDVYFDLKIWQWPDSLAVEESDAFLFDLEQNEQVQVYFEALEINEPYFSIAEVAADTLKDNQTYIWKVFGIKDELIIAESDVTTFSIIEGQDFEAAAKSMLDYIGPTDRSTIYGLVGPLDAGVIIESEEPADIDSITIKSQSYLFIIDDGPGLKFGHPVRYALVEKESYSVEVYDANWFPTFKNSEESFKSTGFTVIDGKKVGTLIQSAREKGTSIRNEPEGLRDVFASMDCNNQALIIDCGDDNRTGVSNNIAYNAAIDADSVQAIYQKGKYEVTRFSQYWDCQNKEIDALKVDPETNFARIFIRKKLLQVNKFYRSKKCCTSTDQDFELFIYLSGNSSSSSEFKIYKSDGNGINENINYFSDILSHLRTLPQCVKIKFVVDAGYSGKLTDARVLDTTLMRGNYQIITATDTLNAAWSGVGIAMQVDRNQKIEKQAGKIEKYLSATGNISPRKTTLTRELISLVEKKNLKKGVVNFGDNIAELNDATKKIVKDLKLHNPNPQYASVGPRYEDTLSFPALSQQSKIKDFSVSPQNSANIIPDKAKGEFVVFAKIKGEITLTVIYEDGTSKKKSINSKWGDGT